MVQFNFNTIAILLAMHIDKESCVQTSALLNIEKYDTVAERAENNMMDEMYEVYLKVAAKDTPLHARQIFDSCFNVFIAEHGYHRIAHYLEYVHLNIDLNINLLRLAGIQVEETDNGYSIATGNKILPEPKLMQ